MPANPGDESLLTEWLLEWEDRFAQSEDMTPEALCGDRTDLIEELRRRIADLKAFDDFDATPAVSTNGRGPIARSSVSCSAQFTKLKIHARGGLGVVYEAYDAEFHRQVALKFLKPENDHPGENRERFRKEAEVTAQLEHPGIVPIYGMGNDDSGHPCYAMRFIDGQSMHDAILALHNADSPNLEELAELLGQIQGSRTIPSTTDDLRDRVFRELLLRFKAVCETIAYAHSRSILHRDIKPINIMLGKFGETLVVDWGIAKAFEVATPTADEESQPERTARLDAMQINFTPTAGPKGTPAYMSPEQAAMSPEQAAPRRDLLPASDVYSLGATLYCLLTGGPPFRGRASDVYRQIQDGKFPPPRTIKPGIPIPLEAICLKAMTRDPQARYAAADELAADVDNWLADRPVTAWREPWAMRLGRWARHHRTAVAMAAVALVAGVIGLGVVAVLLGWYNRRLEQANNDALAAMTFLVESLRSSDPTRQGRHVTVADVLDGASERLEREFDGSEVARGTLLQALGDTYYGFGLYDRATNLHSKAVGVREAALGPDHPDTLTSRDHLGNDHWCAGRFSEAVALHEKTLKSREATLGPEHPDTLTSRHNLAVAYRNASLPFKAIETEENNIRLQERVLGNDHPDTLSCCNNLANSYKDAGRLSDAIALYEATLERRRATLGPDHLDTLQSRNNLGVGYRDAGRFSEAIALFEVTLEARDAKLGPDHPHTLFSRHDLGVAYWSVGRYSEAIKLLEQVSRSWELHQGPDHPETLHSRTCLARAYRDSGRITEAIALQEAALRVREATITPERTDVLTFREGLAEAYELRGDWAEAERLHRLLVSRRRKVVGHDRSRLGDDLVALGRNLLMRSRWQEAESLLRESLQIYGTATIDRWRHYLALSQLGGSLLGQGRYDEAEPLIVQGYEGMKAREAKIPAPDKPRFLEATERVVRIYEAWGQPAKADGWKQRLGLVDLPDDVFATAPGR
jgi:serine/threonine protein kinase